MSDNVTAPITPAQHRLVCALFTEAGVTDRRGRLYVTSEIVGRRVESSADLTLAEASTLIDELKAALGEGEPL